MPPVAAFNILVKKEEEKKNNTHAHTRTQNRLGWNLPCVHTIPSPGGGGGGDDEEKTALYPRCCHPPQTPLHPFNGTRRPSVRGLHHVPYSWRGETPAAPRRSRTQTHAKNRKKKKKEYPEEFDREERKRGREGILWEKLRRGKRRKKKGSLSCLGPETELSATMTNQLCALAGSKSVWRPRAWRASERWEEKLGCGLPLSPYTRAPPSSKREMTCSRPRASLHLQWSSPEAAEETYVIYYILSVRPWLQYPREIHWFSLSKDFYRADQLTDEVKVDRRNLLSLFCSQDICMIFFFFLYCMPLKRSSWSSLSPGNLLITDQCAEGCCGAPYIFFLSHHIIPAVPSTAFCSWTCNKTQVKNGLT